MSPEELRKMYANPVLQDIPIHIAYKIMQLICDADGVDRSYNSFEADLDVISPRERVVNDLVNICADNRVKYENNVVKKFEAREDMLRSIITSWRIMTAVIRGLTMIM